MQLKYYIDVPNNISIRSYHGCMEVDTFKRSMLYMWENPDYSMKQNHIIDLRDCEFQIGGAELSEIAEFMTKNDKVHDRKVALLVSKPMQAGISAAYSHLTQNKHLSSTFVTEFQSIEYTGAPEDIFEALTSDQVKVQTF